MESCIEDLDGNMMEQIPLIDEVRKDLEKVMQMCQGCYGLNSLSEAARAMDDNSVTQTLRGPYGQA